MSQWIDPYHEPPLGEILADPIVRALMLRDHVERHEIIDLLSRIAARPSPLALATA
jgi:hypothetical protein